MKIMKKSFSFVCCLFLAVSCFAPFASASDPSKQVVAVKGGAVIGRIVEHTKVTEHTRVIEFVGIYSAINAGRLPGVGERAIPMSDTLHTSFSVQADPKMYLTIRSPKDGSRTCVAPYSNDIWFTSWLRGDDRSYIFSVGCRPYRSNVDPRFNSSTALDQDPNSPVVHSWTTHGKDWQRWILVPVGGGYHIVQNFHTGACLTYNPSNKQVTAERYAGSNCQHWLVRGWHSRMGE